MRWFGSAASPSAAKQSLPVPPPPKTGEFDNTDVVEISDDILEMDNDSDGRVQAVGDVGDGGEATQQVDLPVDTMMEAHEPSTRVRDRRATVVSPIPAMMAASMGMAVDARAGSTIAPPSRGGRQPSSGTYTVEVNAPPELSVTERLSEHIEAAQALLDAHDFHSAARIAEETLALGEASADLPGVRARVAAALPMLEQIFAGYVGPLGTIPVLVKTWDEIMLHKLGDSTRSFLRRIDGVRSMEQILGHSSIPPQHALRIVASALRAGFIRTS